MNALTGLVTLLADSGDGARQGLRSLVRSLIDEGMRYAATAPGGRWLALLKDSAAVTKGWLLWNHCNVDFYLRNAKALEDSPAALLEAALRELEQADLTTLVRELTGMAARWDALSGSSGERW